MHSLVIVNDLMVRYFEGLMMDHTRAKTRNMRVFGGNSRISRESVQVRPI
jgi:hypothetical protein